MATETPLVPTIHDAGEINLLELTDPVSVGLPDGREIYATTIKGHLEPEHLNPAIARKRLEELVGPVDDRLDPLSGPWKVSDAVKRYLTCHGHQACEEGMNVRTIRLGFHNLELESEHPANDLYGIAAAVEPFNRNQDTVVTEPEAGGRGPLVELLTKAEKDPQSASKLTGLLTIADLAHKTRTSIDHLHRSGQEGKRGGFLGFCSSTVWLLNAGTWFDFGGAEELTQLKSDLATLRNDLIKTLPLLGSAARWNEGRWEVDPTRIANPILRSIVAQLAYDMEGLTKLEGFKRLECAGDDCEGNGRVEWNVTAPRMILRSFSSADPRPLPSETHAWASLIQEM